MRIEQRPATASRLAACLFLGTLAAGCDEKYVPSTPTPPAAAPAITSIMPATGLTTGGTVVVITGTGFAEGATVTFGGTPSNNVMVVNSTSITASAPAHAEGSVDLVVTNADGQSGRLAGAFTFGRPSGPIPPVPVISAISPTSGPTTGGTSVTITGLRFTAGVAVLFGSAPATNVNVVSSTSITATTPPASAGIVNLVVRNAEGQTGILLNAFTYVVPAPAAPTVSGISPASGSTSGGTHVTIAGTGFTAGATVSFGGTAATGVTVASATSITATTPARTAGSVDLVVTNTDGQSGRLTGAFTYVAPPPVAPTVTAIAPTSGSTAGGTNVTLTGTGFAAGAAVSFGGIAASSVAAGSSTSIMATTPAQGAGAVDVVVTNADGLSGRLTGGFTYVAPQPPPVPVITITPNGVSPSELSITLGMRVRFLNSDSVPHTINSDPHPEHTQCPEINLIGFLVPGQSRETAVFDIRDTCGYHDHNDPDTVKWQGKIIIR